jgi:hypothetical protein
MAEQNNAWLANFLSQGQQQQQPQTVSNIIGASLITAGLTLALGTKARSFLSTRSVKDTVAEAKGLLPAAITRNEEIGKKFTADLAGYEQGAVEQAETGLGARGIGDARVRAETASQTRAGLSGAYARAKAALTGARLKSESNLATASANYRMSVIEKQYQSQMKNYADRIGLWSALGGIGTSILKMPSTPKETPTSNATVDYNDLIVDPAVSATPFRMKGVNDYVDRTDYGYLNKEGR